MKKIIIILTLLFLAGCGTEVTIQEEQTRIEPPPSNVNTAGVVSGFGYATGGEHYIVVQSVGAPLPEQVQSSVNGRYKVE